MQLPYSDLFIHPDQYNLLFSRDYLGLRLKSGQLQPENLLLLELLGLNQGPSVCYGPVSYGLSPDLKANARTRERVCVQ